MKGKVTSIAHQFHSYFISIIHTKTLKLLFGIIIFLPLAHNLRLPITVMDIINLPMDEFNDLLSKHELTEEQLTLCRDIRRRGKNKVKLWIYNFSNQSTLIS